MNNHKQIFQTDSATRWKAFVWANRLLLFFLIIMIPMVIIPLSGIYKPELPALINSLDKTRYLNNPAKPRGFSAHEEKKYKGFVDYLLVKERSELLSKSKSAIPANRIRAAFYVDW